VTQVDAFDRWRTVSVHGSARWITEARTRRKAIIAFLEQKRPGKRPLTIRDAADLLAAKTFRIEVIRISGRSTVPLRDRASRSHGLEATNPMSASAVESWLNGNGKPATAYDAPDAGSAREATRAMDSLRRVIRALRGGNNESEREFGLTAAQLFVLRQIAAEQGQSLASVARRTRAAESSVSEVVSRLLERGLVERHVSSLDRRRIELSLTTEGSLIATRAPHTVQERLVAGFAALPESERIALSSGLESWLMAAGLHRTPTTMFFEATTGE
jgi:DNA-binding MarR family transcriptional regulator